VLYSLRQHRARHGRRLLQSPPPWGLPCFPYTMTLRAARIRGRIPALSGRLTSEGYLSRSRRRVERMMGGRQPQLGSGGLVSTASSKWCSTVLPASSTASGSAPREMRCVEGGQRAQLVVWVGGTVVLEQCVNHGALLVLVPGDPGRRNNVVMALLRILSQQSRCRVRAGQAPQTIHVQGSAPLRRRVLTRGPCFAHTCSALSPKRSVQAGELGDAA
jgi:hypothetical protein